MEQLEVVEAAGKPAAFHRDPLNADHEKTRELPASERPSGVQETVLERSRRLLALGLSVIPLKPAGKKPDGLWTQYQYERATDADLVRWFDGSEKARSRNIGIVTGVLSGVVVIDTDSDDAEAWAAANLPATEMRTKTKKGSHRFYRHPGKRVPNNVRISARPLDVRSDGGYVVAPGCRHPEGGMYEAEGAWPAVATLPMFDLRWIREAEPQIRSIDRSASAKVADQALVGVHGTGYNPLPAPSLISYQRDTVSLPPLERTGSAQMEAYDPATATHRDIALRGNHARWMKDLNRFEQLWMMRGAFRRGTRAMAVLVYAYLLHRNRKNAEEVQRAAVHLGGQCAPPLRKTEVWHQIHSATRRLKGNLRRETIDRLLGVSADERGVLDPDEHARMQRARVQAARNEALSNILRQEPDWPSRRIADYLSHNGVKVSFATVARRRRALETESRIDLSVIELTGRKKNDRTLLTTANDADEARSSAPSGNASTDEDRWTT